MAMFQALQRAYEDLGRPSQVEEWLIKFSGFDGNEETKQLGYCQFLCEREGKFKDLPKGDGYNSHAPLLDGYRRMLGVWKPIRSRRPGGALTLEEIVAIVSAMPHPDSDMGKAIKEPGTRH